MLPFPLRSSCLHRSDSDSQVRLYMEKKRVSVRVDFLYSTGKQSEFPLLASFKGKHPFPGHEEEKDTNNLTILFLSDKRVLRQAVICESLG